MPVSIHAVTPDFVAEVGDVALNKVSREDLAAIREAFTKYAVLVFPDQEFDDDSQLDFARHFGPLETTVFKARKDHKLRLQENMAGCRQPRRREPHPRGQQPPAALQSRQPPLAHGLLVQAPAGLLLDAACPLDPADRRPYRVRRHARRLRRAARLDEAAHRGPRRRAFDHALRAKLGFKDFDESEREAFAPVPQVLVRRLLDSGRMSLYIASHVGAIRGMPDDEAHQLIEELTAHATQRQFVHAHRWREKDLVIWDDRCTMHRGMEFDDQRYKRDMRRATVSTLLPPASRWGWPSPRSRRGGQGAAARSGSVAPYESEERREPRLPAIVDDGGGHRDDRDAES